jgi:hypothetical protein
LKFGFRLVTGRNPNAKEFQLLQKMYSVESENYKKHPDKAKKILLVGASKIETGDIVLLATYASIVQALMNTDEFITRN